MPKGREVIGELQKHGILIDIAHATPPMVQDVLDCTEDTHAPIVASHVSAYDLGDHPYSLRTEHMKRITARNGLIGVILMPHWLSNYTSTALAEKYGGLDDVVRTIRYVYKVCGTHKCIAIGSDFAGYITGPRDLDDLSRISELRRKLEVEFASESNRDEIVNDIMAGNAIRLFTTEWGVKLIPSGL
jgi:microsomal dipeptidase-like Zn-dependent dipeptidase